MRIRGMAISQTNLFEITSVATSVKFYWFSKEYVWYDLQQVYDTLESMSGGWESALGNFGNIMLTANEHLAFAERGRTRVESNYENGSPVASSYKPYRLNIPWFEYVWIIHYTKHSFGEDSPATKELTLTMIYFNPVWFWSPMHPPGSPLPLLSIIHSWIFTIQLPRRIGWLPITYLQTFLRTNQPLLGFQGRHVFGARWLSPSVWTCFHDEWLRIAGWCWLMVWNA